MRWQWLDHMQVICSLLQTDNDNSTSSLKFFYGLDALPAAQLTVSKHWRQIHNTIILLRKYKISSLCSKKLSASGNFAPRQIPWPGALPQTPTISLNICYSPNLQCLDKSLVAWHIVAQSHLKTQHIQQSVAAATALVCFADRKQVCYVVNTHYWRTLFQLKNSSLISLHFLCSQHKCVPVKVEWNILCMWLEYLKCSALCLSLRCQCSGTVHTVE